MTVFEKLVSIEKKTLLHINAYKTGKELEDDNPGAHYHDPAMDDKLVHEWSYSIEVDHRNHSAKDIILILEKISHRGFFRNAKYFTYHYSDQYETSFLDGNQFVKVVSHAHYNISESENLIWEF